ncbi:hypothetical protein [Paenibacillus polymyxa]
MVFFFDKKDMILNLFMPIQETFWSPAYGSVIDKFGVQFQISATPVQA